MDCPWNKVPSGDVKIAIEAMAIEIVNFPIKHGDFPVRYVNVDGMMGVQAIDVLLRLFRVVQKWIKFHKSPTCIEWSIWKFPFCHGGTPKSSNN